MSYKKIKNKVIHEPHKMSKEEARFAVIQLLDEHSIDEVEDDDDYPNERLMIYCNSPLLEEDLNKLNSAFVDVVQISKGQSSSGLGASYQITYR